MWSKISRLAVKRPGRPARPRARPMGSTGILSCTLCVDSRRDIVLLSPGRLDSDVDEVVSQLVCRHRTPP